MLIRVAGEQDASRIATAEWATSACPGLLVGHPHEIPLDAFISKIRLLASIGCYWVAENNGELFGHLFLDPMLMQANAHVFKLTIVVHPGKTGRGVGCALMSHALGWARDNTDVQKIELLVRSTNTAAIALYRKFGFVVEGILKKRIRTLDGEYIDDLAMAWFPEGFR